VPVTTLTAQTVTQNYTTTNHLFNCSENPTLWSKPVRAARFLGLDVFDPGGRIDNEDD